MHMPNFNKIRQSAAELLVIQHIFAVSFSGEGVGTFGGGML